MYNEYLVPQHKIINSNQPDKGNLYVGNINSSEFDNIQKLNVKAVVTVARGAETNYHKNKEIAHLRIDAEDFEDFNLSPHFQKTFEFIDDNLQKTNVLVHCFGGISRSVTIVAAYIIKKHKLSAQEVLDMIQSIRPIAGPNDGFVKQLEEYAQKQPKN